MLVGVLERTPLREGIRGRTRVEPRESFGLGQNEDSRPSKIVLTPYFLPFVLCGLQQIGEFEPQTSNLKPQTSNLKPQTSNLKPQTSNLKPFK